MDKFHLSVYFHWYINFRSKIMEWIVEVFVVVDISRLKAVSLVKM